MVLIRPSYLVLLGACSQSLFDNNSSTKDAGTGVDAPVATTCTAPCVGDGGGEFDGTPGGSTGHWRYLDDHRDRTWVPMTPGMTMTGADGSSITSCANNPTAPACAMLPGALLLTAAGATAAADPAIELTAPMAKVVQISLRVHVPAGAPDQAVRLYRNSREDVLFSGNALNGVTLEHTITIDALEAERVLFALAPTAMGAQDVAVQLFVSDTGAVFPQDCQLAVSFSGAIGNDVDNLCGGDYTHEDYNAGPMPPTLGAGPFAEQGQAADIVPDKYYVGTNLVVRTGDTTLQMWMRHDALVPLYEAWAFSDLDLDVGGGLGIVMYDSGGLKLEVNTCTSGNPITFASERAAYPDDHAWHFVRVVQKGGTVTGCIDGKKQLTFPAAAGTLASMYRPRFGRNVIWTPSGAFWDGGLDDIRVFNGALPCE